MERLFFMVNGMMNPAFAKAELKQKEFFKSSNRNYLTISRNSSSLIIVISNFSAFSSLEGPILSPRIR